MSAPDSVHAGVSFSFKGETHRIEATLDLARHLSAGAAGPDFHLLLAQAGGIDPYSYLYEVLESSAIDFSRATGGAAPCCRDGLFDWGCYWSQAQKDRDAAVLSAIAARHLGVTDLTRRPDLQAALRAAYQAGQARGAGLD